ncbi:acetyl-coenzyme A transporter 1-domain-containing protein [Scheffersomyces coipomensis]|uniref:acetyl-coenzyme A transporter 1-domain-containing protein n=1 Tax=Scheffersomyces coipomensis TaxID=1788519 RepID=UPI00315D4EA0
MSHDSSIHKRTLSAEPYSSTTNELNYSHAAFDEVNDGLLPMTHHDLKEKGNNFIPSSSNQPPPDSNAKDSVLRPIDRPAFFVLVILYLLQGVPVGLAFGSIPFILKSKLSYSQVGIFSLAAYPYSLKLIWSPIVDAFYFPKIGRRRSWIIPIQTISGLTLIYLGSGIDILLNDPQKNLPMITACFFLLVFFCATQDIAVDGWALTCLSPDSLSYASTAQTIGINTGYFSSFTIFLALSSPDFANKYLRDTPIDEGLFSLGQYLRFWGFMYLLVTGFLYFVPEDPAHLAKVNQAKLANEKVKLESVYNKDKAIYADLIHVYSSMYKVLQLPNVQTFVVILLISKLGFQVNEAATNLKLLEKGLSKEDLSITVLIDFPFEMIFGYYAGRWSSGKAPLRPWIFGFAGRLVAAAFAQLVVYFFPEDGKVGAFYFCLIILQHLLSSFMSTIQFVSLCAFHTKIADPAIGGTYMTTLNTLSNYGGTWPRLILFYLIDKLTISNCELSGGGTTEITSETVKEQCLKAGGKVIVLRDGYYYTNAICVILGVIILIWVKKKTTYLQSLPNSAWRVNK